MALFFLKIKYSYLCVTYMYISGVHWSVNILPLSTLYSYKTDQLPMLNSVSMHVYALVHTHAYVSAKYM